MFQQQQLQQDVHAGNFQTGGGLLKLKTYKLLRPKPPLLSGKELPPHHLIIIWSSEPDLLVFEHKAYIPRVCETTTV